MPEFRILTSTDELVQNASLWNELWEASEASSPLCRAEPIQLWFQTLSHPDRFRAVVVEDGDRWAAAIPVELGRCGPLGVARLPRHPWSDNGDLLIRTEYGTLGLTDQLLSGLAQLPVAGLWVEACPAQRESWNSLIDAANFKGHPLHQEYQHSVGLVRLLDDADRYDRQLSKNHRKNMRKAQKRAEELGDVHFYSIRSRDDESWRSDFQQGLQIEDANWKGEHGSSMLRTPGMAAYFEKLAEQLNDAGYLELLFLEAGEQALAFELGYTAKGTYFSHKVGFDERFADYSPGHLLMAAQIREFHQDASHLAIDCLSPLSAAAARWCNVAEPRDRLLLGQKSLSGRLLVNGYRHAIKLWRSIKQPHRFECPTLGATGSLDATKQLPLPPQAATPSVSKSLAIQ